MATRLALCWVIVGMVVYTIFLIRDHEKLLLELRELMNEPRFAFLEDAAPFVASLTVAAHAAYSIATWPQLAFYLLRWLLFPLKEKP